MNIEAIVIQDALQFSLNISQTMGERVFMT